MQTYRWLARAIAGCALSWCAAATHAERLVIDYMISSGQQRTAWVGILNRFAAANPDIQIVNNEYAQEQYKRDFIARLEKEKVDIAFWFAGERLRDAAERKLLAPLDASQVDAMLKAGFAPNTIEASRIGTQVYGVPLSYYAWGFFYRKSVFETLGIRPPATWAEFLQACDRLKAAKIAPMAFGAKSAWPAAGWFDYLNLRLNGIEFHRRLLRGEESFRDARVRRVFDEWRQLLAKGYFLSETMHNEWDDVLPYLYRGRIGMTLMGGFMASKFPPALASDIGFFPFPRMLPDMPMYEEAPLDVLVLPARGENRRAARRFVQFLVDQGIVREINDVRHTVSPQKPLTASEDAMQSASVRILDGAAGLTYFFDRDAKAPLVRAAFEGFRAFLKPPHDADAATRLIEELARH